MRTRLIIAVAVLQALVLAYMAGEREWVLRHGRTLFLRTAPVDPRDAMRGDYVRLNYEISRVPLAMCRGKLAITNSTTESVPRGTKVYASLRLNDDGLAELASLSDVRPAEGLFIRGRTEHSWGQVVQVRYGLEAYFTEQGAAAKLEQSRNRGGIQVPLEMQVAVGSHGTAVLKGHRLSALGIGLDVVRPQVPETNRRQPRPTLAVNVLLYNASTNDLAIVDLPGGRSLALVPDERWQQNTWRWARDAEPQPSPQPANVVVLKPGETNSMHVDFKDPAWFVVKADPKETGDSQLKSLTELTQDWSSFRIEYRPPDRSACQGLPNASLIWHGRLPSRAFNPWGGVD